MSQYNFKNDGSFILENFKKARPFSSFLPGVAGVEGIPIFAYYCNRGQCIASFGVEDKDHCIMEFSPADKSYQEISFRGFRTFIKTDDKIIEPFSDNSHFEESMTVNSDKLTLTSLDKNLGFKTQVTYFTIPNENFGALCRRTVIKNLNSSKQKIEVLDGLAKLLPYGIKYVDYKKISTTLRAWMQVYNLEKSLPIFRVRASTGDSETVEKIYGGYFGLTMVNGSKVLPIVDPSLIFGENTSLSYPDNFETNTIHKILSENQITCNKVPCFFTPVETTLEKSGTLEISTVIGYVENTSKLEQINTTISSKDFFNKKQLENQQLIEDLSLPVKCETSNYIFDYYIRQCYLDNILRGGNPIFFNNKNGRIPYYIFSRKHGDLERDYNDFHLEATPYSQGNANFRDVCQNRRCDNYFYPEINDYNIKLFSELIQIDGYNPLVVNGTVFKIQKSALENIIQSLNAEVSKSLKQILKKAFLPGELFEALNAMNISSRDLVNKIFNSVIFSSEQDIEAKFQEGYWVDHFTYILDLINSYLAIYPEKLDELLYNSSDYRYFKSPAFVEPREKKYILKNSSMHQINAVTVKGTKTSWLKRTDGSIFTTSLFVKLLTLVTVKISTLDPDGIGIAMEAGKPGWNDSLNGLPGIFGSSFSETVELKRLSLFLLQSFNNKEVSLSIDVFNLLSSVEKALTNYKKKEVNADFTYWNKTSTALELFRSNIKKGIDPRTTVCKSSLIKDFLLNVNKKLDYAIEKAKSVSDGIYPTFFSYKPILIDLQSNYCSFIIGNKKVKNFKREALPHFLEGSVHALKVVDKSEASKIVNAVKKSDLYDKKLKMYKISGSLKDCSSDIGRASAFTSGWLENESIFLHMEYKYLLSILKAGLYDEFFEMLKDVLVPFMPASIYGRSIIENSSFIASSANPDESLHGQGFVSRLSGSTVEMLNIWTVMTIGESPFKFNDNTLTLEFSPCLPKWLFSDKGTLSFTFLGKTKVTYHNPRKIDLTKDTSVPADIVLKMKNGEVKDFSNAKISEKDTLAVRDSSVTSIDVFFL